MRIGLAYNEKPDSAPDAESDGTGDAFAEWDDPSTITAVEQALGLFGTVIRLEADQFFPQKVVLARPDLVFNMAEGLHCQSREALVPAICEYLNIPYTGSDPLTLALSLHKGRTKETLAYRGVPTAPFTCIEAVEQIEHMALPYPVFVKPVAERPGQDRFGVPNVLELNPLPGIIPDPAMNSCFPKAARAAGFDYDELIQEVVRLAWRRLTGQALAEPGKRPGVGAQHAAPLQTAAASA